MLNTCSCSNCDDTVSLHVATCAVIVVNKRYKQVRNKQSSKRDIKEMEGSLKHGIKGRRIERSVGKRLNTCSCSYSKHFVTWVIAR